MGATLQRADTSQLYHSLVRAFETKRRLIRIVGSADSAALAALLASTDSLLSHSVHVILTSDNSIAEKFLTDLKFFNPRAPSHLLTGFDVSPYSGLYPNSKQVAARMGFLYSAMHASPGNIFVSPLDSLLQQGPPKNILIENVFEIGPGFTVPSDFSEKLVSWGYYPASLVEDVGSFAVRGGIIDIFSPAHPRPIRLEVFGDLVDSIRCFDAQNQRSLNTIDTASIIPAREVLFNDETTPLAAARFRESCDRRKIPRPQYDSLLKNLARGQTFNGLDFLVPYFYEKLVSPLEYFPKNTVLWVLDPIAISQEYDNLISQLKSERSSAQNDIIAPEIEELYSVSGVEEIYKYFPTVLLSRIDIKESFSDDENKDEISRINYSTSVFSPPKKISAEKNLAQTAELLVRDWRDKGYKVFLTSSGSFKIKRIQGIFIDTETKIKLIDDEDASWEIWFQEQDADPHLVHLVPRQISDSYHFPLEKILFLDDAIFSTSKKFRTPEREFTEDAQKFSSLSFQDLKVGDLIVHVDHGIGYFNGLQKLSIAGIDAEFITLKYKDNDKLLLPVYRVGQIQKYSGPASEHLVAKLGTSQWAQTKVKVQSKLRDVASELLSLYAQRDQTRRPNFEDPNNDYFKFEDEFQYEETNDQLKSINDILADYKKTRPMDRLICGDVGFGKTEVAMRAAFRVMQEGKLVAIMAPTTVLTLQHLENFKKRFSKWPFEIRLLNRFVAKGEATKTISELKSGKVNLVIGTHRLLSKDIDLPNLGLLIIDEEHRFGVMHKEKIRKMSHVIDTLALSATPIPRTLNMSLVGIRDISIINTAPVDRLPIRTFICKFDEETIVKAIRSEIARGGQIFFIHNRIQSIYALNDELKKLLPDVRIAVGHGQMEAKELEDTFISFFRKDVDMLLCTTIVESGMDIPNANTMFIDRADTFGLSQLYQLRGRIGRSTKRAYCYLLIPESGAIDKEAQERLKIIQENTALGSGFRIAHHDLELRGAGNILGEDQSGHIAAVGFELYYELLEEALKTVRDKIPHETIPDPEISVRIPALIPDDYMPDIRLRLAYYKTLSQINSQEDIDRFADELKDQFGPVPEPTLNLMSLMLVRSFCRDLRIRDLSSGAKSISLAFTDKTPLPPDAIIKLTSQGNKKYSFSKDGRLQIRMNEITLPNIFNELEFLLKQCD
ncbi:MAG: hypothetical protein A4S09_08850 [Proteobacteria bacterium SG_bin7]|nr:MAG: hypothetical protein A4S09_08850 [Proteobacteria bacterium SG_bin7]